MLLTIKRNYTVAHANPGTVRRHFKRDNQESDRVASKPQPEHPKPHRN